MFHHNTVTAMNNSSSNTTMFLVDPNRTWAGPTLQHEIQLKTKEPVYVKQFKIPDAHREVIEKHVKEWLALGVVEPARSRNNSPVLCGKKGRHPTLGARLPGPKLGAFKSDVSICYK